MVVRRIYLRHAAIPLIVIGLASCDFFSSPFPGFLSGLEQTVDVNTDSILSGSRTANGVRYDLELVGTGADRRLLLLVEPPNEDPDLFSYAGRLIVMDTDLQEEIRLESASTIDFLSRPFGYGHDGSLFVGYSIYITAPLTGATPDQTLDPAHGLEGFITVDTDASPDATRFFALPSGSFTAFHLEIRNYDQAAPNWALRTDAEQIEIVPDGLNLSDDDSQDQLGYQLLGLGRDGSTVRFLFSRPSEQEIIGVEADLSNVVDAGASPRPVLLPDSSARLFTIDADRPQASVDDDGFFLLRRNGWFERYDWDGELQSRIVGDTSFLREYAFDTEGGYFYRFDPASATLSKIRGWW